MRVKAVRAAGFSQSKLCAVNPPDVSYARSGDVAIAYQVIGYGPVDIVFMRGFAGDLLSSWDQPLLVRHVEGLAATGRVLMLDKRGTGLSDRVREVQSLETSMDDIRAVMDAAGSERAVLWTGGNATGVAVLFAATYPERCAGLVLFDPRVMGVRQPDYPWAQTEEEWRKQLADLRAHWGERSYFEALAREWAPEVADDQDFVDWFVWHMRRSLSPGAALTAYRTAMELDVRDVLAAVRVPTLVLPRPATPGPGHYTAARIKGAEVVELPELRGLYTWVDDEAHRATMAATASFVSGSARARKPSASSPRFCSPTSSVRRSWRQELGDTAWRELLERHHAIVRRELARFRGRELDTAGDGFFAVLRWARPRRPGCRRAPRTAPSHRPRDPRRFAHGRVRGQRRQGRRDRRLDRRPDLVTRRRRRGPRLEHRQGPGRRLRPPIRRSRRARAQRASPTPGACSRSQTDGAAPEPICRSARLDRPLAPVDRDPHPGAQPRGRIATADHRRDAVLAGDDRSVRRGAADVSNDGRSPIEQRRPRRRGQRCDEDLTGLQIVESCGPRMTRTEPDARPGEAGAPDTSARSERTAPTMRGRLSQNACMTRLGRPTTIGGTSLACSSRVERLRRHRP